LLLAAARRSPAASRPNRVIATALMTRPHICPLGIESNNMLLSKHLKAHPSQSFPPLV
jgi:hypothetical protein